MATALFVLPLLAGVVLWLFGLQLLLRSGPSVRDKIVWTAVLVLVGVTIGTLPPP